jgi:glycerophosphoryl diester phosphodiesterase
MNKFLPKIIAHRGACADAPENTLMAIKLAKEIGACAVEIDVCLTRDKEPVVFHDHNLKRLFSKNLYISEMNYDELRSYDLGEVVSKQIPECKIPHFREVLLLCNELQLILDVELKPYNNNEDLLAKIVSDNIKEFWDNNQMLCITSFSKNILSKMQSINNSIPLGYIIDFFQDDIEHFFKSSDCQMIIANADKLTESSIGKLNKLTDSIYAYTVNTRVIADRLFTMGVKGIFTDKLSEFYAN